MIGRLKADVEKICLERRNYLFTSLLLYNGRRKRLVGEISAVQGSLRRSGGTAESRDAAPQVLQPPCLFPHVEDRTCQLRGTLN